MVGSVNVDQSFTVVELPRPGQTVLASSVSSEPGGKGGNQAVAAARAGASVHLVAALGDDPAASGMRAHLRGNGVALDGVVTVPGPSGAAAIVVDARGENTIVVAPGANAHLTMTSAEVRAVVADADVALIQLEIPIETALAAARIARDAGAVVIVNASPARADGAGLEALSHHTDVVIANEDEASQWRWPVTHLVITRGAQGARHVHGDEQRGRPRSRRRAGRHHWCGRCVRRSACRGMAFGVRRGPAAGLCGGCARHADTRGGRMRTVRRGDRRRAQRDHDRIGEA